MDGFNADVSRFGENLEDELSQKIEKKESEILKKKKN
jgi:hypothetical protein